MYPVALTEGTSIASKIDFSPIIDALNLAFTPSDMIAVIASCIGVGAVFFLMWFGVRKLVKSFTTALTKGKIVI